MHILFNKMEKKDNYFVLLYEILSCLRVCSIRYYVLKLIPITSRFNNVSTRDHVQGSVTCVLDLAPHFKYLMK